MYWLKLAHYKGDEKEEEEVKAKEGEGKEKRGVMNAILIKCKCGTYIGLLFLVLFFQSLLLETIVYGTRFPPNELSLKTIKPSRKKTYHYFPTNSLI